MCDVSSVASTPCSQLQAHCVAVTHTLLVRQHGERQVRERRRLDLAQPHPHQPAGVDGRVAAGLDLRRERLGVRRVGRRLDDLAGDVDLPPVEDAAQAAVLVAGQHQRGVAVRAALVEEARCRRWCRGRPRSPGRRGARVAARRRRRAGSTAQAGIQQCSRMSAPIGASPSMRVRSSFCSRVSTGRPPGGRGTRSPYRRPAPSAVPAPSSSRTTRASFLGATNVYEVRTHSSTSRQRAALGRFGSVTDTQPWRPSP